MLKEMSPEKYEEYVVYEGNNKVLYMRLLKTMYGMMNESLFLDGNEAQCEIKNIYYYFLMVLKESTYQYNKNSVIEKISLSFLHCCIFCIRCACIV